MKASTRCAIAGWALGFAVGGLGLGADELRNQKLTRLDLECAQAHKQGAKLAPGATFSFEEAKGALSPDDPLLCNPYELQRLGIPLVGVQRQIMDVYNTPSYGSGAVLAGMWIAGLLTVPYLWYAFLRRLRELSDAVRARPPTGQ